MPNLQGTCGAASDADPAPGEGDASAWACHTADPRGSPGDCSTQTASLTFIHSHFLTSDPS